MVVALKAGGINVSPLEALSLVWGYGVGVDLTRRDIQDDAKKLSRPWDWAKGFDASAPCSPIHPVEEVGHPDTGEIWLKVNSELKQHGDLQDLIWSIPDVISYISQAVALAPGDLIYSGTPAGVGPMQPGDDVSGGVDGVAEFTFTVGPRPA
jgi:fumarylpyruvate hydrolase